MNDDPVTIIITRHVREGSEKDFESAVESWIPQSLAFPGHLGIHMLRPPLGGHEYGAVLKFRNQREWTEFQHSPRYLKFLSDIEPYLEYSPNVQTVSGLESWFTPLGGKIMTAPPRWKMAIVTWVGVCGAVYGVQNLVSPLMAHWPFAINFALSNGVVVALLAWLIMPALSRLLRIWLLPTHRASSQFHQPTVGEITARSPRAQTSP